MQPAQSLLNRKKKQICLPCFSLLKFTCYWKPAPVAQSVECPLQGTGAHWSDPGTRHTKVVKNGSSCSLLGTQTYGVELGLVDLVSGQCDWVLYHVKCLGHDTSVKQHYKDEHWAPCHNQTPLWYDWKYVESDIKAEQITTLALFKYLITQSDYKVDSKKIHS